MVLKHVGEGEKRAPMDKPTAEGVQVLHWQDTNQRCSHVHCTCSVDLLKTKYSRGELYSAAPVLKTHHVAVEMQPFILYVPLVPLQQLVRLTQSRLRA
ncbi:hypothetical protein STCU_11022 [Strigomonas culicis]|uniref:Uncharacterized protein n=1 Tax=Strigomonas culicis TaxID=28005 RepID=S9V1R9_9TRYP|nr:hypothetical protein STCU_11022 [Strigomonas culicis]|eukprot:EPY16750.1 hypothetical protein STCU_11022 [Strigomonas culicis]